MRLYRDRNSFCIGAYRDTQVWFICLWPTVILKVKRRNNGGSAR